MIDFQIIECDQGEPEWHFARAGAVTASMFHEVRKVMNGLTDQQALFVKEILSGSSKEVAADRAGYKSIPKITEKVEKALDGVRVGDWSSAAKDYAFRLAVERITGKPLDGGFSTWAMQRGNELEPEARLLHEQRIGVMIEQAGFVKSLCGRFGASADGLIEPEGGSEYKCLVDPARMRQVIVEQDLSDFMDQMQGGMWITGRKWWHYGLYCPDLKEAGKDLILHHVARDDDYIAELEADVLAFDRYVEHCKAKILDAEISVGMGSPQPEAVKKPEPKAAPQTRPTSTNVFMTGATA